MQREFDEKELLKVVGARLSREYDVTQSALPEPIALVLAKLHRAEQVARPQQHVKTVSEN
jgi:hypothetical protein